VTDKEELFLQVADRMIARVRATHQMGLRGFPHYADTTTGEWTVTPDGFWTGGFWPGCLWLAADRTKDDALLTAAGSWTERLRERTESQSVFKGFLFHFSAANGAMIAGDADAEKLGYLAAESLKRAFIPELGLIPLGKDAEEAHTVGDDETNIDGISASLVMGWAGVRQGDRSMIDAAITHALKSGEYCVREDGSVLQSASFDAETGALVRNYTHKGYRDDSVWTRAQGWAMLGFSYLAGIDPADARLLKMAEAVCDWWIANIPDDLIAYWDFDAPRGAQEPRDTSGTAIAVASLLRLAHAHPEREKAEAYRRFAERTAQALCDFVTPTGADDGRPVGILTRGCFDKTRELATDNELIWGDYFLLEALLVLSGQLQMNRLYPAAPQD
jgi:unsaturated chondroitin disaccharide hydrolase